MDLFPRLADACGDIHSSSALVASIQAIISSWPSIPEATFDADAERAAVAEVAKKQPDILLVLPALLNAAFYERKRYPRTLLTDIASIRRVAADGLAELYPHARRPEPATAMSVLLMVPYLAGGRNNNMLRVVLGYLGGLLRRPEIVDVKVLVTNEMASGKEGRIAGLVPDSRNHLAIHRQVEQEFDVPAGLIEYAPSPFSDEGSVLTARDYFLARRPNIVFVPNVELTSAHIHGMNRSTTSVYLQTSLRNRPPYEFDRYLYLGERRQIRSDYINPERWFYHRFGYEKFGFSEPPATVDLPVGRIIITAGNRLENEASPEFAVLIGSVLRPRPDVFWLLLGVRDNDRVMATIRSVAPDIADRVVMRPFVENIGDYLSKCALYANPSRSGGAVSMALSVFAKTPVVSYSHNDACNFLLPNLIHDNDADYVRCVERLLDNADDRTRVGEEQYTSFMQSNSVSASVADLVGQFSEALNDVKAT